MRCTHTALPRSLTASGKADPEDVAFVGAGAPAVDILWSESAKSARSEHEAEEIEDLLNS